MDYQDAEILLARKEAYVKKYAFAKGQDPHRTKLKHVTYLKRSPDDSAVLVVELFGKDIMFYHPDGSIVLDSCGWRTVTTKKRFNEYLPRVDGVQLRVHQSRGVWYVTRDHHIQCVFADGITLHPDGEIEGDGGDPDEIIKMGARINKYTRGYVDALLAGRVPAPSASDCWYCSAVDAKSGTPLGESMRDRDHLVSHIEESYYVPSLLHRAVEVFPVSRIAMHVLYGSWAGNSTDCSPFNDVVREQLRGALRKYLRRQLDLAS